MILKKAGDVIVIRYEKGEDFPGGLIGLLGESGFYVVLSAAGMLKDAELGYFDGQEYRRRKFEEAGEVVSLSGSLIPGKDGFFHIHAALAFGDHSVAGGHLFGGRVENTLELFLLKTEIEARRVKSGKLSLLDF
ncbi:MAG: DUF296 domain-containing protein [Candidatus Hydrothermae bacterium]|nr:DUF296 domain-containing protein [Candidatus Hydrothermae bacterium]